MAGGAANPGLFAQAVAEAEEKKRQYGQLTGYEPIPGVPGGYNFQTAAGRSLPFTGAQAEQMRQQVDAAQRVPPQAATFASTPDGGRIALKEGGDPRNVADYIKETPGSRGRKAGMVAQGMASRGGYELDPERMGEIQESQKALQASFRAGAERQQQAAAERQGAMEALRAQASQEAAVMAHENAVKQRRLDASRASYQKAEQDFLNEPERQKGEREKNKGRDIVNQIAMAVGAFGASMARTPNFVANTIEANNEREMRREEAELRVKKEHKDSLLGRLRDEMGSMELAQTAYRSIRTKESALRLEQLASKESDAQRSQELLQAAALQNQKYLMWQEQLERGQQGEIDRTFRWDQGASASGPRRQSLSLDEHAKVKGLLQADATLEKTRAEAARGGDGYRQVPHEKTQAMSALAGAISAADRIDENIRARGMGEDDTVDNPLAGGLDYIARGASSMVGGDLKRADDQLEADTFALARGIQTDYGKSDNDALMADRAAIGTGSFADRLRTARDTKARAIPKLRSELSTMPPADQKKFFDSLPPNVQDAIMGRGQK